MREFTSPVGIYDDVTRAQCFRCVAVDFLALSLCVVRMRVERPSMKQEAAFLWSRTTPRTSGLPGG